MRAAGADQTKAVEAAKPVAQYDRDLGEIKGNYIDDSTEQAGKEMTLPCP